MERKQKMIFWNEFCLVRKLTANIKIWKEKIRKKDLSTRETVCVSRKVSRYSETIKVKITRQLRLRDVGS